MNKTGTNITDVIVDFNGKSYGLARGIWPDGSAALLLMNPDTNGISAASAFMDRLPRGPNEAFVPEIEGLIKAFEDAGVVKPTSVVHQLHGSRVRLCEVIHPDLVRRSQPEFLTRDSSAGKDHAAVKETGCSRDR